MKTGSGKSYWDILEGSNPHEDGKITITTMLEAQVQRSCLVDGHSVGMVDQTGTAVYDTVETQQDTPEGEEIYKARCDEWDTVTEHVWSQLLAVCTGEPGVKLLGIADKDGKGAWSCFKDRWDNTTTSTIMAGLEALLDYSPKGVSMAQHVTGWADLIRKLKLWGVPLTTMPTLESMLFLRTLPKKYNDFVNHKKLQGDDLDRPTDLYVAATAWSASADGGRRDEANTHGKALFGGGTNRQIVPYQGGAKQGAGKRAKITCFNCNEVGHYQSECEAKCGKCGRKGHAQNDCYSRAHANGTPLQVAKGGGKGSGGKGKGGKGKGGRGKGKKHGNAFISQQNSHFWNNDAPSANDATSANSWFEAGKQAAQLEAASARLAQFEKKAGELGMKDAFGLATPAVGEDENEAGEIGEALECLSLRGTVVLKADSGADRHYVNDDVPLHDAKEVDRRVYTADKNTSVAVTETGLLAGKAKSTTGGVGIEIQAEKSAGFRYNLFSVRQAVRNGHKVVFGPAGSYIEAADGVQLPLRTTRSGWELHVTGCGGSGNGGYAFPTVQGGDDVCSLTQPERRSSV